MALSAGREGSAADSAASSLVAADQALQSLRAGRFARAGIESESRDAADSVPLSGLERILRDHGPLDVQALTDLGDRGGKHRLVAGVQDGAARPSTTEGDERAELHPPDRSARHGQPTTSQHSRLSRWPTADCSVRQSPTRGRFVTHSCLMRTTLGASLPGDLRTQRGGYMDQTHGAATHSERRTRRNNYLIRNQTPHELALLSRAQKRPFAGTAVVAAAAAVDRRPPGQALPRCCELCSARPCRRLGGRARTRRPDAHHGLAGGHRVRRPDRRRCRRLALAWGRGLLSAVCSGFHLAGLVVVAARRVEPREDDNMLRTEMEPSRARGDWWDLLRDLAISVLQGLVVVLLFIVAIGAPALAIYYGTELHTCLFLGLEPLAARRRPRHAVHRGGPLLQLVC